MSLRLYKCSRVVRLYLNFILIYFVLSFPWTHGFVAANSSIQFSSSAGVSMVDKLNNLPSSGLVYNLVPIKGTMNYRIYGSKKRLEDKHWLDSRGIGMQPMKCVRNSNCERLIFSTCLGAKLPYEYTSLDLSFTQEQQEIVEWLNKYQALKYVPKCWAVIQPFLCAVFVPKCENINGEDMVYLPSLEMCRITLEPCRILYNTSYFPEFLRCNETHFPSKCNNDVREMKFNLSGQCLDPLVPAESSGSYYPGIEGCGIRCKDPLYTDDEHRQIHKLIAWGSSLCLLANLFVVATFIIDWDNASKYPALIVFYINFCFLISCFGWLVQFTSGSRDDIVCRKDGTRRFSEPTAGQNLSCVLVFVIVYYFLVAAMVWFVFLTYAWHLRAVGNFQDRIDKKGSYFHLVAWSLPLVLTITTLALSEVDGNSTVGICFVGYLNHPIRIGLLLGPLLSVIFVGGYFVIRGMIMLCSLKHFANVIKSTLASNKIHVIIVRMGICAVFTLLFILVAVACHIYEFRYSINWSISLREYIKCRILTSFNEHIHCKIEQRPSVAILQLHLLCLFGAGIAMSTWCWTPSSAETWKRYLRHKLGRDTQDEAKMPKHKVIAQTWAKRKEFEDKGRLSITLYNTHTDPVGINFDVYDINSSETIEISSTWANYLPKCVKRRMALTLATNSSSQGHYKSSVDSEISFSVRHVSVESRRNSVDSQVSVKIAEMKTKVASRSSRRSHRHKGLSYNTKRTPRHPNFKVPMDTCASFEGRRESSTSIESRIIALNKNTYPTKHNKSGISIKNLMNKKRKSSNVNDFDIENIAGFLAKNGQMILPFLEKQCISSSSESDASQFSLKKSYRTLNTKLKDDSNDKYCNTEDSNKFGLQIEEINDKNMIEKPSRTIAELSNVHNNSNDLKHITNMLITKSNNNKQYKLVGNKNKLMNSISSTNKKYYLKKHKAKYATSNKSKHKFNKLENREALLNMFNINANAKLNDINLPINDAILKKSLSEIGLPLDIMLNSSYSDLSVWTTNFCNSKTSCDVAIQTNAYEVVQSPYNTELTPIHLMFESNEDGKNDNIDGELETLLNSKKTPKDLKPSLNEAEKLKMLLLP